MEIIKEILEEMQEYLDDEVLDVENEIISDTGEGILICMKIVKEKMEECGICNEQEYKEVTKALQESGIPLPLQKEIQEALDEKFNQKWIPCSERLPEENQIVIGSFVSGTVATLDYRDGLFHGIYEYNTNVVTAWQPLPSAYKESEEYQESCTGATDEEGKS